MKDKSPIEAITCPGLRIFTMAIYSSSYERYIHLFIYKRNLSTQDMTLET